MKKLLLTSVAASLLLVGCATVPSKTTTSTTNTNKANTVDNGTSTSGSTDFVGHMSLAPQKGDIGSKVTVSATSLPPNTAFDLVWQTEKENWVLTGKYHETFAGRNIQDGSKVLAKVKSDSQGKLQASFSVPDGFGYDHTVSLVQESNHNEVNQALYVVEPQAFLDTKQGPLGSPIQITMKGIGAESYSNNWMLVYDNKFTGFISAVTTNGTAHVTIPATGSPGKHVIEIVHGAETFPYWNTKQSPHPKPIFHLVYTVTNGSAVLPKKLSAQTPAPTTAQAPSGTATAAWVSPSSGPTAVPLVIHARGLQANQTVKVTWSRMVGSHVTSTGYVQKTVDLGTTKVANDGTLTYHVTPPADLGGAHTISIVGSSGKVLATTKYMVNPSAVSITPDKGPVGTTFTVHLQGVGWTDTANIYTVDYDDSYTGYVCGFNSQGDVEIPITATGKPGWHYIDLYPAIYKGTDMKGTDSFRLPQLTYAADHPGEKLPAFHFAFYVTGN